MAGKLQIAITGTQDQWLTGAPEISYFTSIFKRHSQFSTEAVELPLSGDIQLGSLLKCRVPSNVGDLVRSTILKIEIDTLSGTSNLYNTSIGTHVIQYADLKIGGQTIERITGDFIYMYNQLNNNTDETGTTLYYLTSHNRLSNPTTELYVHLPFYFFRNPSLAIPVCALTKQQVEVHIKFKKLKDVTVSYTRTGGALSDPPSVVSSSIKTVSLVTDFFFITDDEKSFLFTRPIEYVITQVQLSQFKFNAGISKKSGMLNFKNPVKEMFFMAVSDDVYKYEPLKQVTMKFNNNTIIDADNLMLSYEQPLKYYTGTTGNNFGVYSFSLKPETYYPTGQVNMSRIAHNLIEIELDSPDASFGHKVYVYAVNYNVLRIHSGLGGLKF